MKHDPPRPPAAGSDTLEHGEALPAGPRPVAPRGYRILRKLGEGGMGEVWLAEQADPVRREVALKFVKPGRDSAQVLLRFDSERAALALMDHPAIARVYDGGATSEGRPYFSMEYVDGVPLTAHCDGQGLPLAERLELFLQLCAGVRHAHQKAILHRDLKPSNALVATVDGKPQVKIIDFGIAKALGPLPLAGADHTRGGGAVGTPEYMSPEQAWGRAVDTRTDVHALGVVLCELLAGARPFPLAAPGATGAAWQPAEEAEPRSPSELVASAGPEAGALARARGTDPVRLRRALAGDLDAVVLKAVEADPDRRYQSVEALAEDLARVLREEPVQARRAGPGHRLRKFVRRHRLGVATTAVAAVGLAVFVAGLALQNQRIVAERDRANREREASRRVTDFLTGLFKISNPSEARGNAVTARELLDRAAADVEGALGKDPVVQAQMMETMGTVYWQLGLVAKARPLLERSLTTRREQLGAEHPDTLQSAHHLAVVLWQLGEFAEAERLARQTLETRRRVMGQEAPATLETLTILGLVLKDQERPEAEPLLREALEVRTRQDGPESERVIKAMINLGAQLQETHRYAEAEALQRRCLDVSRRVLGPDHPLALSSLTNLSNTLMEERSFAEAEALAREALGVKRRVLGPEHPNTLNGLASLADILAAEGQLEEAGRLQREALEGRLKVLGPDHKSTARSRYSLATYALRAGQPQEALRWLEEALAHGLDGYLAQHLGEAPELAALRGQPRFEALLARAPPAAGR